MVSVYYKRQSQRFLKTTLKNIVLIISGTVLTVLQLFVVGGFENNDVAIVRSAWPVVAGSRIAAKDAALRAARRWRGGAGAHRPGRWPRGAQVPLSRAPR